MTGALLQLNGRAVAVISSTLSRTRGVAPEKLALHEFLRKLEKLQNSCTIHHRQLNSTFHGDQATTTYAPRLPTSSCNILQCLRHQTMLASTTPTLTLAALPSLIRQKYANARAIICRKWDVLFETTTPKQPPIPIMRSIYQNTGSRRRLLLPCKDHG